MIIVHALYMKSKGGDEPMFVTFKYSDGIGGKVFETTMEAKDGDKDKPIKQLIAEFCGKDEFTEDLFQWKEGV